MGSLAPEARAFAYPKLLSVLKTSIRENPDEEDVFWNAKFYPYGTGDEEPVFSLSNKHDMLVCRVKTTPGAPPEVEIIRSFQVHNPEEGGMEEPPDHDEYCSSTWAYLNPDEPLLLGAGDPGLIRVFDVVSGNLKTTLVGHGLGVINELSTHPQYPWIIASASFDKSVRIWDLRRWNSKHESATIIICGAGYGHKESVLSVSWHSSGRYLISGGFDNRVCVWTIPDLSPESSFWHEISPDVVQRHSERVRTIMSPHFVSTALHGDWIDCVRFWGDNIFSKASAEPKIVLWRITGFNSNLPQPDPILAPKAE
jgi:polycomb protein EED